MSRPSEAVRRFLSCRTPGALRRLRDAGDEGFTLIELVVVLVILPLVMGALAVALLVTFREQVGVSTRISTSADAQVTSAYFVRDVESAMYVTTDTGTPNGAAWPSTAGPTTHCGSGTALIVSLAWPSVQQPIYKTATVVSYWRMQNGLLERDLCQGSASHSSSITSRDFVSPFAHALLSCVASVASETCAAAATRWVPAQWVSGVTIAATEPLTKTEPLAKTKGSTKRSYDFSLTAAPRASGTAGAYATGGTHPVTKVPPLLALGTGTTAVVKESSTASITVSKGPAVLNSGYFEMEPKTQFRAPNIWVTTGNTPCAGLGKCGASGKKGSGTNTKVTICAMTKNPPAGTCYTPTPHKPKPWTPKPAYSDPFATLSDPTAASLTYQPRPCQVPSTGKLQPGEYDCHKKGPFTISGRGVAVSLAHGIYIFDTGMTVQGNARLTGNTVLIYLPCKVNDPWVPTTTMASTTCKESFQVSDGLVTVSPLRTGRYSNLWLWVNKGVKTTTGTNVKLTASGPHAGGIAVKTGVLYAPSVEVQVVGLGTQTTVGAIVAKRFDVSNSTITVEGFG